MAEGSHLGGTDSLGDAGIPNLSGLETPEMLAEGNKLGFTGEIQIPFCASQMNRWNGKDQLIGRRIYFHWLQIQHDLKVRHSCLVKAGAATAFSPWKSPSWRGDSQSLVTAALHRHGCVDLESDLLNQNDRGCSPEHRHFSQQPLGQTILHLTVIPGR